jgi:hypothetical protein
MPVGRRALADVYRHIENLTSEDRHQLALGPGVLLVMEPAENPLPRMGEIVLHKRIGNAIGREAGLPVRFKEETPIIPKGLRFDEDKLWNFQSLELKRHL